MVQSKITLGDHTHTHDFLRPFFWDHPCELVPEENFWTLWCKGRLTQADTPTIRLGATPSGLTSAHLHHLPFLQVGCPSCRPTNSVKALKATSAFGLGRRCKSSPQWCYLHCLRTTLADHTINIWQTCNSFIFRNSTETPASGQPRNISRTQE